MNYIGLELPYNGVLVLPARMAKDIADHALIMKKEYVEGVYQYSMHEREDIELRVLREETITAAKVAKRVTE